MTDVTDWDDQAQLIERELKRLQLLNPDWDWFKCQRQLRKEHPELFPPLRSKKRYTRQCVICGTAFTRSRSDAKTCSMRCAKGLSRQPSRDVASQKAAKKPDKCWCVVCEKEFLAFHEAKTCSPRCRKALSRSPAGHLARLKRLSQTLHRAQGWPANARELDA